MKIGNFHIGFQKRAVVVGDGTPWLSGYAPNGVYVDNDTVLSLSAVWSCVRLLSESISGLPCGVKQTTKNGIESVDEHPANTLLKRMANPYMDSLSLKELIMTECLLRGNFYGVIIRDSNARPTSIIPVMEKDVKILKYDDSIIYEVKRGNNPIKVLPEDMFHVKGLSVNGISGVSVITAFKEGFGLALSAQRYGKEFYDNGTHLHGYIKIPGKLDGEILKKLKDSWNTKNSGLGKQSTSLLDGGSEFVQLGMKPEDAQYLGSRTFQSTEIATWFRVPNHMINIGDRATYNNIESYAIEFVQYSLMPWIRKIETEVNNKLLRESEKGQRFFKFNVNGLMRGDAKTRAEYYGKMSQIGAMSINDIRGLEDQNSIEGGDRHFVPMNMMPLDKVDLIIEKNGKTNDKPTAND